MEVETKCGKGGAPSTLSRVSGSRADAKKKVPLESISRRARRTFIDRARDASLIPSIDLREFRKMNVNGWRYARRGVIPVILIPSPQRGEHATERGKKILARKGTTRASRARILSRSSGRKAFC